MLRTLYNFLLSLLRGAGQVIFQENPLTGLFVLIGLGYCSWTLLWMGGVALFIATLFAHLLPCSKQEINQGLWGFNGFLVGLAVATFFRPTAMALALLVAGAILSVVLPFALKKYTSFPLYTAPFVLIVWAMFLIPGELLLRISSALVFREPLVEVIGSTFRSFSQVFLQGGSPQIGAFVVVGLLLSSTKSTLWGLLGAIVPLLVFYLFREDYTLLNAGLLGYNGVLVALALGTPQIKGVGWVLIGIFLALGLQLLGVYFGLTTLTAPFVLATWLVHLLKRAYARRSSLT